MHAFAPGVAFGARYDPLICARCRCRGCWLCARVCRTFFALAMQVQLSCAVLVLVRRLVSFCCQPCGCWPLCGLSVESRWLWRQYQWPSVHAWQWVPPSLFLCNAGALAAACPRVGSPLCAAQSKAACACERLLQAVHAVLCGVWLAWRLGVCWCLVLVSYIVRMTGSA